MNNTVYAVKLIMENSEKILPCVFFSKHRAVYYGRDKKRLFCAKKAQVLTLSIVDYADYLEFQYQLASSKILSGLLEVS